MPSSRRVYKPYPFHFFYQLDRLYSADSELLLDLSFAFFQSNLALFFAAQFWNSVHSLHFPWLDVYLYIYYITTIQFVQHRERLALLATSVLYLSTV